MTEKEKEKIINANMALGMSREEAEQVLQDDLIIDKGGKCDWEQEQTPEQKKMLRQLLRAESDKPKEKKTRTKKENPIKQAIVILLRNALEKSELISDIIITNAEREITFKCEGVDYKLTLSVPRPPKN